MNLDLLVQIAISNISDDSSNLFQGLLESFVGLLMLAELALELTDVFGLHFADGPIQVVLMVCDLLPNAADGFTLTLNLVRLLFDMVSQVSKVFFREGTGIAG